MNCIKCGKELTDGRRKICKECAEKEKAEKEAKKAAKLAEKKSETKKSEVKKEEKKKTTKENNKEKKSKEFKVKKEYLIIGVIALVFLACLISVMLSSNKKVGNTIGNIRNYGYACLDGKYIYYLAPNEDSTAVGIFKIKKDGTGDKKELFMEDLDVISINVSNGYIYFIGIGTEEYTDADKEDNKIYKMKTNGEDLTVINDNEFNNDCYEIYVVNNKIYYIGTDNNIYSMDLNGGNRTLVSDKGTGYLGITDKYIIYNATADDSTDYTTYIMNIDGTNQRPILEGQRLYSVGIYNDYVYYTNVDKKICRTKLDSGESEVLLDTTAYNLNLYDGYLYFLNYKDTASEDYTVCLYRIKADGSEKEATSLKELDSYSSFINVIGDWVIYMDSNETEGFINLVKKDGSGQEICLYLLDYTQYYENIDDTIENVEQEPTTENTVVSDANTVADNTTTENSTPVENTVTQ